MGSTVPIDMTIEALRRGALSGARALTLSGGLTEFPREIFGLAGSLEVLDLSGNALSALPDDLGRLTKLRALFCSGNRFTRLPEVLGDCGALSQVGFRGCGLRDVPAAALPPALRWLTLTDNRIESLPGALGERPLLQKLMLAGNRLGALPESLVGATRLELLRVSANRLDDLPRWLAHLPRLAWLAWAGNPWDRTTGSLSAPAVAWRDLALGALLGAGASGWVHHARWQPPAPADARSVAVKLFKGAVTSDGLPEREMAACLASGEHPNLMGALGRVVGHPTGADGLLMPLLSPAWRSLAGPPDRESCSRDVYDPDLRFDPGVALRIVRGIAAAAAHLHARGLLHGDLYAHNILWDGVGGDAVLSDFGAASFLRGDADDAAWQRLDVRAWGLLLGEMMDRCTEDIPDQSALRELHQACVQPDPSARPLMAEVVDALGRWR
jgi:hypothetical protein